LDLELARVVQRSFLPVELPAIPGYEFTAHYQAASEVGGDYYDFITLPGHRIAVLLGDVAGKGVAAALVMAKLSADARVCMLTESDPAAAFTKLNALMSRSAIAGRFVTLVAAVLDPVRHFVTLVNAGHPSPLLYQRATKSVADAISSDCAGVPLCVAENTRYTSCNIALEPGDCILSFTDGVTDAMDVQGRQLETSGVFAAVRGGDYCPRTLGEKLVKTTNQFSINRGQHDDIAIIGFGRD
jgi:serine phosphatase RsbU (regulator of sigma subunit)